MNTSNLHQDLWTSNKCPDPQIPPDPVPSSSSTSSARRPVRTDDVDTGRRRLLVEVPDLDPDRTSVVSVVSLGVGSMLLPTGMPIFTN